MFRQRRSNSTRIAIFLPSLAGGGAERVMCSLGVWISKTGRPVDLVVAKSGGWQIAPPDDLRLVSLDASRTFTAGASLRRYVRTERPAAVISALTHANVVAIGAVRSSGAAARIVVTEHIHLSRLADVGGISKNRVPIAVVPLAYRGAHAIVAVSSGVGNDLAKVAKLDRRRVSVIYNPIDFQEVRTRSREKLDHPWIGGPEPVVVTANRLVREKDVSTLVRALAVLRRSMSCRLIVLGDGPERGRLGALASDLGLESCVDFPGFVSNPYPYFAGADIFALSSRLEGLPTVLLEVLALGTPIVSTDCPSGPREILLDGRLGDLVPVGDASALAQTVSRRILDRAARRRPYDEPRCDPRAVADAYTRLCIPATLA